MIVFGTVFSVIFLFSRALCSVAISEHSSNLGTCHKWSCTLGAFICKLWQCRWTSAGFRAASRVRFYRLSLERSMHRPYSAHMPVNTISCTHFHLYSCVYELASQIAPSHGLSIEKCAGGPAQCWRAVSRSGTSRWHPRLLIPGGADPHGQLLSTSVTPFSPVLKTLWCLPLLACDKSPSTSFFNLPHCSLQGFGNAGCQVR